MADKPINLNRARKARDRKTARDAADRNAVIHGMTKAERQRAMAEVDRQNHLHEQGRIVRLPQKEDGTDGSDHTED